MSHPTLFAALALLAAMAAPAQAGDADDAQRYDAARDQYEVGHYAEAFSTFAALADKGHCDAIRVALQMARTGRRLYPTDFKAAPERLAGWVQDARCGQTPRQMAAQR